MSWEYNVVDWQDRARKSERKARRLGKELKDIKGSRKPVDMTRCAAAVVRGLNEKQWDKAVCMGATADSWLNGLFEYLRQQGVELK
jgi:hypothetical protein